jgi:hypothetical protein
MQMETSIFKDYHNDESELPYKPELDKADELIESVRTFIFQVRISNYSLEYLRNNFLWH